MNTINEKMIIFGAGGHAKSVISVIETERKWQLIGLLEDDTDSPARLVLGYEILGSRQAFDALRCRGILKSHVAIGDNAARAVISAEMEQHGFALTSIVHPSACLMQDCTLGDGSFVHALSLIGAECRVGRNAIILPHVSLGHESQIGDHVQFSPGVHIGGQAQIGDYCFFGPGAVVYPKIMIGRNVSIGANTVVHKDVPDNTIMAGNPAKIAGYRPAPE